MNVLSPIGWISYRRYALRPVDDGSKATLEALTGAKSVYPLDEHLGLDNLPFCVTCDMALLIAKKCICADSYEEVAKELTSVYGVRPGGNEYGCCLSDDTVRKITDYVAGLVLGNENQFVNDMVSDYSPSKIKIGHRAGRPKNNPFIVYLQTDGATYPARAEGEIEAGYRENKLGVVFTSDTMEERVDAKGHLRPKIGDREYICNVGGVEEHRKHLIATALKYGLEEADAMVILTDGAEWARLMKRDYFPFAQQILDLYHLKENVHKFADQEFGTTSEEGKKWAEKVCDMLENGKWREVLELPEVYQYSENGKKELPKGRFNLYNYIWNFRDCIDYPTYLELGYLIGSGAVESGHRTVLQKRLKQPGMRWLPSRAEGILCLRAKYLSGLWDIEVRSIVRKNYRKVRRMTEGSAGDAPQVNKL